MVTLDAATHFANKTGRTLDQAIKLLSDIKQRADKANAYKIKHPSNAEWSEVQTWRDPKTTYTIWVTNNQIVHVIVKKLSVAKDAE